MEDPWGSSPWATNESPPKLDLPAAPPSAHFPIENTRTSSPRRNTGGWGDEEDAWGGWNEAGSGTNSPGWGRSPGLKPARSRASSRAVSPVPWRDRKASLLSVASKGKEEGGDSATSFGQDATAVNIRAPVGLAVRSGDDWGDMQWGASPDIQLTPSPVEVPDRSVSPEGDSPGPPAQVEEHQVERPGPIRQASKVQELVTMYDGIARSSVSPAQPTLHEPPSKETSDTEEETSTPPPGSHLDDTTARDAVSEELAKESLVSHEPNEDSEGTSSEKGWDEEEAAKDELVQEVEDVQPETIENDLPSKETPYRISESDDSGYKSRSSKRIDLSYSPDLTSLDALFPTTVAANAEPEPIPDIIIDDTFASISERKAWYRLSRPGSLRMHNMGHDEDYVRIDWQRSTVRMDTLKTVRRWMEEDSIAGRVVLGRKVGAVGAGMFNWNSSAPPVEIGELFGKKSRHSRQSSLKSKGSIPSPTAANFSWSSPPVSPIESKFGTKLAKPSSPGLPPAGQPKSMILPPPTPVTRPSIDQALAKSVSSPIKLSIPAKDEDEDEDEDDDDDWGEMMTSPINTVPEMFEIPPTASSTANGSARPVEQVILLGAGPIASRITDEDNSLPQRAIDPWDFGNFDRAKGADTPDSVSTSMWPSVASKKPLGVAPLSPYPPSAASLPSFSPTIPTSPPAQARSSNAVDDETVAFILNSLPDLSYMLR